MLLIVGEGNQRSRLEALAREFLHVAESVIFLGTDPTCQTSMHRSTYSCCQSIDEGMPMALLEALAAAKPVVATRVAAVPEACRRRSYGHSRGVERRSRAAEAVVSLLGDAAKTRIFGHQRSGLGRAKLLGRGHGTAISKRV